MEPVELIVEEVESVPTQQLLDLLREVDAPDWVIKDIEQKLELVAPPR